MKSLTWVTDERQGLLEARCIDGQWSPLARGGEGPHPRNHEVFGTRKAGWPFSSEKSNRPAVWAPARGAWEWVPAMACAIAEVRKTPWGPPWSQAGQEGGAAAPRRFPIGEQA